MIGSVNFLKAVKKSQMNTFSWQDHGVFWDSEGVIHVDFLPCGVKINAQYYSNLLQNDVDKVIQMK
jgi:hypothetical protein